MPAVPAPAPVQVPLQHSASAVQIAVSPRQQAPLAQTRPSPEQHSLELPQAPSSGVQHEVEGMPAQTSPRLPQQSPPEAHAPPFDLQQVASVSHRSGGAQASTPEHAPPSVGTHTLPTHSPSQQSPVPPHGAPIARHAPHVAAPARQTRESQQSSAPEGLHGASCGRQHAPATLQFPSQQSGPPMQPEPSPRHVGVHRPSMQASPNEQHSSSTVHRSLVAAQRQPSAKQRRLLQHSPSPAQPAPEAPHGALQTGGSPAQVPPPQQSVSTEHPCPSARHPIAQVPPLQNDPEQHASSRLHPPPGGTHWQLPRTQAFEQQSSSSEHAWPARPQFEGPFEPPQPSDSPPAESATKASAKRCHTNEELGGRSAARGMGRVAPMYPMVDAKSSPRRRPHDTATMSGWVVVRAA